jgi:predicted GNAT superfamily acetyltransferase
LARSKKDGAGKSSGRKDGGRIEIETLKTDAQFRDAVALQKTVWGFEEIELVPVRLFVVATQVGGQAFGAYHDGRMIAFCLALPGLKPGPKSFLHSQMLGVLPAYRDAGVGRRLKLRQREDAVARGIDLIEWTFDPLEIKNAYFNVERLGAVVRRYVRNQYGTTTSHLHGGLPTDRCTAEWWVSSQRVRSVVHGDPFEHPPIMERIQVPAAMNEIRRSDPKRARELQEDISDRFEDAFDRGLAVVGVDRSDEWGTYLLGELA